jgi:hypothetical protein
MAHTAIEKHLSCGELPEDIALRDCVMSAKEFIDEKMIGNRKFWVEHAVWVDPSQFEAGFSDVKNRAYPDDARLYGTIDFIGQDPSGQLHLVDWKFGNLHELAHSEQCKLLAQIVSFITGEAVVWHVVTVGRLGYATDCEGVESSIDMVEIGDLLVEYPVPYAGPHCCVCPAMRTCVRTFGHSDTREHIRTPEIPKGKFSGKIESREQRARLLALGRALPDIATVRLSKTKLRKHYGNRAGELWRHIGMDDASDHSHEHEPSDVKHKPQRMPASDR